MRNEQKPKARTATAAGLTLAAIGVVFGDIGTSPLYALRAIFGEHGLHLPVTAANVYGVVSLIIWAIIMVVCVKYIGFVMRAGNKGEGGVMALVALIKNDKLKLRRRWTYIFLGLVGVTLFYGDSAITPAISVLSAVEGLKVVSGGFTPWILPITILLLGFLFWVQRYGTAVIGRLFGPVMVVWFVVIGAFGALRVLQHPESAIAFSPFTAVQFFAGQPLLGFLALGAVILAVTGAETLYADMGHFGRRPIARAWFMLVFPALVLSYLGQGAMMLAHPTATSSPFMALFPGYLHIAVIILATVAALIASQSVISGAFSLTRQAIQLGFLPRMRIMHTSEVAAGQIYIPFINLLLCVAVALLIVVFGSSSQLAVVYGIAVSGTLLIDSLLFLVVARTLWHKPVAYVAALAVMLLTIDLAFVTANVPRMLDGGWLPVAISISLFIIIHTWIKGRVIVSRERQIAEGPLQDYIDTIRRAKPPVFRVPGCAVYIGHHAGLAPLALHAAVEKLHELHEKVVIVTVRTTTEAHIPEHQRAKFDNLSYDDGISHLSLSYGYHDTPNVPHTLKQLRGLSPELDFDTDQASYFVSLSKIVPGRRRNMAGWRKTLFALMSRNALSTSDYYHLPIDRTIELRSLTEL
ncbi:MAG TPA: KUP/HAK/KT family potassium transporter [Candidatus Saccharimonadales bacterium]|jgi:KUP system potassium uptake protein